MKRLKNNGSSASSNASFSFKGGYGRNTDRSSSAGNTVALYASRGVRLFTCVFTGLFVWLFPTQALAESPDYTGKLTTIIDLQTDHSEYLYDITEINNAILGEASAIDDLLQDNLSLLDDVFRSLGYRYDGSDSLAKDLDLVINFLTKYESILGYGIGSSQNGTIKSSLDTIDYDINALKSGLGFSESTTLRVKLDEIILALENLQESGGSGSDSINQDWVKEDTFTTKFDGFTSKYEDFAQRYFSAFGFTNEQSLKDVLSYFIPKNSELMRGMVGSLWQDSTPFPVTTQGGWMQLVQTVNYDNVSPFYKDLNNLLWDVSDYSLQVQRTWAIKQSWNDWYSHTNLVATLNGLVSLPENRVDSSNDIGNIIERDGNQFLDITYEKETGDAFEEVNLTPTLTNDVASLEVESTSITNKFNKIWNYRKIKERYIDESKINLENVYNDVTTRNSRNFVIEYGTENYMTYEWGDNALSLYRQIFSYDRMKTLRGIFGYLWQILISFSCYCLFRILGKVK